MADTGVKSETAPLEVMSWNVYSTDGDGVRCIYDKKSKWLLVEQNGYSSSVQAPTLAKARDEARAIALDTFRMFGLRRQLTELGQRVTELLR